jgi:tRNA acetyltransferase TAN1
MTCPAEIHIILKTIVPLLRNFFQQKDNKRLKFKVELRIRNNNSVSKSTLLPEVVKLVGRPHVVDLNSPDTLIIIEIFRVPSLFKNLRICHVSHQSSISALLLSRGC